MPEVPNSEGNCPYCGDKIPPPIVHECWLLTKFQLDGQESLVEPWTNTDTAGSEDAIVSQRYAPQYPDYT